MLLSSPGGRPESDRPGLKARFAAARRAFGPWRAGRPFVGAVLTILAGLEMLLSGPIDLGEVSDVFGIAGVPDLQLAIGIEGFQATVLPIALILLGVLAMVQPVHRIFYGVIILVISVYSLSGVNLGGWVVGFLLGAIGGLIVVSWSPADAEARVAKARAAHGITGSADDADQADPGKPGVGGTSRDGIFEVSDGAGPDGKVSDDAVSDGETANPIDGPARDTVVGPNTAGNRNAPHAKSAAVVLAGALAISGLNPMSVGGVRSDICWDPLDWIPSITCEGDEEPSPSPSGSPSPSSSPSGSASGGTGEETGDGSGEEGADGSTDPADPGTDDSKDEDGDKNGDKDKDEESDGPAAEIFSEDESTKGLSIGYVCDGKKSDVTLPMISAGEDNRHTFSLPADLKTKDLEISGIQSIALVSVPVTHGADRRDALRIVADHVKAPGFWLKSYAYDELPNGESQVAGTDTTAGYVSMDGNATMYISGINLGCPDFEEIVDAPPESIIAWLLALSGAQMDLLGATSDVQVWSGFREQVWGDPLHPIGEGPTAGTP